MRSVVSLCLLLAVPAAAQQAPAPAQPTPYQRAIAAGYKAAMLCSGIFNAGRTEAQVAADELRGIYPEYQALVAELPAKVDHAGRTVTVAWSDTLPPRRAQWVRQQGCTNFPIGDAELTVSTGGRDGRTAAGPDSRAWPMGDAGVRPRPSPALAATVDRAFDRATYGQNSETVGVVVLRDGKVVAERYRDGFGLYTSNRTWSVAKSLAGAVLGVAQAQGAIDVAQPAPVPEWQSLGDPRRQITTDQLLRMSSGLHSATAGNRTDAIYFGGTAVTEEAVAWPLEVRPGTRFRYANNDTLLAVRALRAKLGEERHRDFPARELFLKLGMNHTVAETDWKGNYILSSQVWSTARDLARFGQFMLQDGVWQERRLLPAGWMAESLRPSGPQPASGPGYGRTLWLFGPKQGLPEGSYAAQGNRGQYVMVIPSERLVVVRRGEDPGPARFDIAKFTADVLAAK
ncbi:serine hydrolase domain-containing protein [Sphingomonas lenta]|uniref:Serine hydrolase n=1 Tax=Sphingomonas lenta TaxID=1141887 RepID=A0A2A2SHL7_9SPHN|nr:serine hydrolase [Sphingomonas lenta]PAX08521.1 serine hydrolase [Sphingomonas lenta]